MEKGVMSYPSLSLFFGGWGGSRGLTNVLRLHPHLLLFLFVDNPSPALGDRGCTGSAPHYGDACHMKSVARGTAWVSLMSARPQTHESDKVTGKPNLM